MKRTLLSVVSLLLAAYPAMGAQSSISPVDLVCITQYPTTSFIGETSKDRFHVRMVHSNGVGYMPIHSGLVTINDIENLKKRAEVLKNIEDISEFSFELKNCQIYQDKTFQCSHGSSFQGRDGKMIEVFSLSSSKSETKLQDISFEQVQISLYLIIEKESYFIQMNYSPAECSMTESATRQRKKM